MDLNAIGCDAFLVTIVFGQGSFIVARALSTLKLGCMSTDVR